MEPTPIQDTELSLLLLFTMHTAAVICPAAHTKCLSAQLRDNAPEACGFGKPKCRTGHFVQPDASGMEALLGQLTSVL